MNPGDSAVREGMERRRYFRVDDSVILDWRPVPPEDLPRLVAHLEEGFPDPFTLRATLEAIGRGVAVEMHQVERRDPELAQVLRALDAKLDAVAGALLAKDPHVTDRAATAVNLSASGMAFRCGTRIEAGTLLELRLVLWPSLTGILVYGETLRASRRGRDDPGLPWEIAVDFQFIREGDRDLIIRHVMRRQQRALIERGQEEPLGGML